MSVALDADTAVEHEKQSFDSDFITPPEPAEAVETSIWMSCDTC